MKVAVAFDHRGITLRAVVIGRLLELGHEVLDLGTDAPTPKIDYPDKALELGEAIRDGRVERGVFVCSSGVGAAVAANKIPGVRACLCHDTYTAHQGVEDDDLNVLCLGSEVVGQAIVPEILDAFVSAAFDGGERYVHRLEKLRSLERMTPDSPNLHSA